MSAWLDVQLDRGATSALSSVAAGKKQAGGADPKLENGARDFEAMMIGEMFKGLNFGESPDSDGEGTGGANDTIRSFGTEAVAKAVASGGGFGLARQIVRQVSAEHDAAAARNGITKV